MRQNGIWIDDAGTPRPHQFVHEAGRTLDFPNEYFALFALRFIGAIRAIPQGAYLY